MISVISENTENPEGVPEMGWVFYDRDCRLCSDLALRLGSVFAGRGFTFQPLQEAWVQRKLGMTEAEALQELRVLTPEGKLFGGAEAITFLAGLVWWISPLTWIAKLGGGRRMLRALYRWTAEHRHCSVDSKTSPNLVRTRWVPLLILPLAAFGTRSYLPPWGFMWAVAAALYLGCKWLTLCRAKMQSPDVCPIGAAFYLIGWPGMDAVRFLSRTPGAVPDTRMLVRDAISAVARIVTGGLLLFGIARYATEPLLAGWIGMIGMIMILHFGVFELSSIGWRTLRVDAPSIMRAPLRATSVGEFWSRRWNGAFNQLALRLVFRPLAKSVGIPVATLGAFGVSGVVHELVISLPANAGYGLPTAYFLLQGVALLAEHTSGGKRLGLGSGVKGWLFTILIVAAPAFWLFHPAFVQRVILPFMQAIGAL